MNFVSALRPYLLEKRRACADAAELQRFDNTADRLNSEAADLMDYRAVDD